MADRAPHEPTDRTPREPAGVPRTPEGGPGRHPADDTATGGAGQDLGSARRVPHRLASSAHLAAPTRRAVLAGTTAAGVGLLAACGASSADPSSGAPRPTLSSRPSGLSRPRSWPELPRGGRELFPRYRLVGYCGLPGATALGRLGIGDPSRRVAEIEKTARSYAAGREPLPVLELLATVANNAPGPGGTYRTRTPSDTIRRFLDLARAHHAMLLLNIQPGRARVMDEVTALHPWLVHPDVGVALDPEWEMGPGEVPGTRFGHTSGTELDQVAGYLAGLVRAHRLPQKPLVFHQVATSVLHDEAALRPPPEVAVIKSADGIGSPGLKRGTWQQLVRKLPDGVHTGFKLFYQEDAEHSRLMTPKEVLALRPRPEYVMYE